MIVRGLHAGWEADSQGGERLSQMQRSSQRIGQVELQHGRMSLLLKSPLGRICDLAAPASAAPAWLHLASPQGPAHAALPS